MRGERGRGALDAVTSRTLARSLRLAQALLQLGRERELDGWIEVPLARNEVYLEAGSIRIREEDGVVAGGPVVLSRRMDDSGTELCDEAVNAVHVLATTGSEAQVVESGSVWVEAGVPVFSGRPADAEAGSTSHRREGKRRNR